MFLRDSTFHALPAVVDTCRDLLQAVISFIFACVVLVHLSKEPPTEQPLTVTATAPSAPPTLQPAPQDAPIPVDEVASPTPSPPRRRTSRRAAPQPIALPPSPPLPAVSRPLRHDKEFGPGGRSEMRMRLAFKREIERGEPIVDRYKAMSYCMTAAPPTPPHSPILEPTIADAATIAAVDTSIALSPVEEPPSPTLPPPPPNTISPSPVLAPTEPLPPIDQPVSLPEPSLPSPVQHEPATASVEPIVNDAKVEKKEAPRRRRQRRQRRQVTFAPGVQVQEYRPDLAPTTVGGATTAAEVPSTPLPPAETAHIYHRAHFIGISSLGPPSLAPELDLDQYFDNEPTAVCGALTGGCDACRFGGTADVFARWHLDFPARVGRPVEPVLLHMFTYEPPAAPVVPTEPIVVDTDTQTAPVVEESSSAPVPDYNIAVDPPTAPVVSTTIVDETSAANIDVQMDEAPNVPVLTAIITDDATIMDAISLSGTSDESGDVPMGGSEADLLEEDAVMSIPTLEDFSGDVPSFDMDVQSQHNVQEQHGNMFDWDGSDPFATTFQPLMDFTNLAEGQVGVHPAPAVQEQHPAFTGGEYTDSQEALVANQNAVLQDMYLNAGMQSAPSEQQQHYGLAGGDGADMPTSLYPEDMGQQNVPYPVLASSQLNIGLPPTHTLASHDESSIAAGDQSGTTETGTEESGTDGWYDEAFADALAREILNADDGENSNTNIVSGAENAQETGEPTSAIESVVSDSSNQSYATRPVRKPRRAARHGVVLDHSLYEAPEGPMPAPPPQQPLQMIGGYDINGQREPAQARRNRRPQGYDATLPLPSSNVNLSTNTANATPAPPQARDVSKPKFRDCDLWNYNNPLYQLASEPGVLEGANRVKETLKKANSWLLDGMQILKAAEEQMNKVHEAKKRGEDRSNDFRAYIASRERRVQEFVDRIKWIVGFGTNGNGEAWDREDQWDEFELEDYILLELGRCYKLCMEMVQEIVARDSSPGSLARVLKDAWEVKNRQGEIDD